MAAVEEKTEVSTIESEKTAEDLKTQNDLTPETNPNKGKTVIVYRFRRLGQ
jgi:hypothetical protein